MANKSYSAPRGMRDFYPEDMVSRNHLFDCWKNASELFCFSEYDSSVVETLDLLKRKSGEEIGDQIYFFKDKSDRELALRPEITPTLARMIVARQGALSFPVKWFTIAQCFRYERTTRGRKREHYQWNLDIIGEDSVSAEAEVIATAIDALSNLGLSTSDYHIHFSSRALLADLLTSLGIDEKHHPATFLALDKRGKIPDDVIEKSLTDEGLDEESISNVFSLLKIETIDDARAIIKEDTESLRDIDSFVEFISTQGNEQALKFDISIIRGLSYYTGIVFEAFDVERKFRAIFGGGRYDDLLSSIGGKPASGVGLGFGDVVIQEILDDSGKSTEDSSSSSLAIGFMENDQQLTAVSIAAAMRQSGRKVDVAFGSEKPKQFFSRVGKGNFKEAIYIGPDDIESAEIRIKNLEDRTEETVALTDPSLSLS